MRILLKQDRQRKSEKDREGWKISLFILSPSEGCWLINMHMSIGLIVTAIDDQLKTIFQNQLDNSKLIFPPIPMTSLLYAFCEYTNVHPIIVYIGGSQEIRSVLGSIGRSSVYLRFNLITTKYCPAVRFL